ncbi:hypothetical protein FJMB80154_29960 [Escherichia coli]|nr:hypothetical protein FJMB80154_29960 [Escherichia coli]
MTQKHRDRTEPKYKALDMTEHALKVAIRTIDRHAGEGYAKEHPDQVVKKASRARLLTH